VCVIGDRAVIIIRPDRKHGVEQLCVVARVFLARNRDRDGSSLLVDFTILRTAECLRSLNLSRIGPIVKSTALTARATALAAAPRLS
jgi:hypothetical protein